ncbi:hypothetical protein LOK49_LG01G03057 [Camellia lanceoleosa]|uniref:Uncharacterized protein n=1 Tax=Camellia lanceoleosa TaxID=1840588 RepID=A0ACC0IWX8_9ERIC|nr:hypothetical protein LOK49_LG01G03057 [Camellia lanceoleosa]
MTFKSLSLSLRSCYKYNSIIFSHLGMSECISINHDTGLQVIAYALATQIIILVVVELVAKGWEMAPLVLESMELEEQMSSLWRID